MLFFLARVHIKYWGSTVLIAGFLLICGYFFIEKFYIEPNRKVEGVMKRATTWVGRIDDMVAEWNTPNEEFRLTDDNYQRSIAKVAIARGGASPLGVGPGNSTERDFLPQAFADYIFAIICEELGLFGAIAIILMFIIYYQYGVCPLRCPFQGRLCIVFNERRYQSSV